MKAIIGKRYAQIANGRCHWKFDHLTLPEWADGAFEVVDITDLPREPDEGDLYDGVTFSKPPAPPVPASRTSGNAELVNALIKKGVITRGEIDAELQTRP